MLIDEKNLNEIKNLNLIKEKNYMCKNFSNFIFILLTIILFNITIALAANEKSTQEIFIQTGFDAKGFYGINEISKIDFCVKPWSGSINEVSKDVIDIYNTKTLVCNIKFKSGLCGFFKIANFKEKNLAKKGYEISYGYLEGYKEKFFLDGKFKSGYLITNNHMRSKGALGYLIYKNCVMHFRFFKNDLRLETNDLQKLDELIKKIISLIDQVVK